MWNWFGNRKADGTTEGEASPSGHSTNGLYGIKILNETTPEGTTVTVDIVFVHGLTGNRVATWTDKSSDLCWPEHLLPKDLPQARVMTFGYDADVVNFWGAAAQTRLGNHAQNLVAALAGIRARTATTNRPIIFVAHSLGGLVAEDALLFSKNSAEPHHQEILECTRAIAFLGTPHCGSDLADWASMASAFTSLLKKTNKAIVGVLKPDSEVLSRVQREFHTMLRVRANAEKLRIAITCFYEELPVLGVGLIVPMHSAALSSYTSISIHSNHIGMTKFNSAQDAGYVAIFDELFRWTSSLKVRSESQPGTGRSVSPAGQQIVDTMNTPGTLEPRTIKVPAPIRLEYQFKQRSPMWQSYWHTAQVLPAGSTSTSDLDFALLDLRLANSTSLMENKLANLTHQYREAMLEQVLRFPNPDQQHEIFSLLVKAADGSIERDRNTGRTLLHYMAMNGAADLVSPLVDMGFDVSEGDSDKRTPLHIAVISNHADVVQVLVEKFNSNVNAGDLNERLPWNYALAIDIDSNVENEGRETSKERILKLLAKHTDVQQVGGRAQKILKKLKENPEATIEFTSIS